MSACNSAGDGCTQLAAGTAVHNVQQPPGPTLNINTSLRLLINLVRAASKIQSTNIRHRSTAVFIEWLCSLFRKFISPYIQLSMETRKNRENREPFKFISGTPKTTNRQLPYQRVL